MNTRIRWDRTGSCKIHFPLRKQAKEGRIDLLWPKGPVHTFSAIIPRILCSRIRSCDEPGGSWVGVRLLSKLFLVVSPKWRRLSRLATIAYEHMSWCLWISQNVVWWQTTEDIGPHNYSPSTYIPSHSLLHINLERASQYEKRRNYKASQGSCRKYQNSAYFKLPGTTPSTYSHNSTTPRHAVTKKFRELLRASSTIATMINAVLVFNNSGQPRLTKFYTQLVNNRNLQHAPINLTTDIHIGHQRTTTPHLRDLHPRLPPPRLSLQLPPVRPPQPPLSPFHTPPSKTHTNTPTPPQPPPPPRHHLPHPTRRPTPRRHALSNNLPALRHALLHPNIHIHGIPPRAARSHPSIRRSARPAVRKRV